MKSDHGSIILLVSMDNSGGAPRLVLASASPRRMELLRAAGYAFDVVPAGVDERRLPSEIASDYVARLAEAKVAAVMSAATRDRQILGADTVVVVDGRVLGKPADNDDAADMLRLLSGRAHDVLTGVALRLGDRSVRAVERTIVHFDTLTDEQIRWYVASGEPRDKAGAYAVQGLGSRFVFRIEGSYSNVVGLPITVVGRLLQELATDWAG